MLKRLVLICLRKTCRGVRDSKGLIDRDVFCCVMLFPMKSLSQRQVTEGFHYSFFALPDGRDGDNSEPNQRRFS